MSFSSAIAIRRFARVVWTVRISRPCHGPFDVGGACHPSIIFLLLFLIFRRVGPALLILGTLPFALVGAIWLMHLLGHDFSVASAVGMIALAGLAAEFGVLMLVYLDEALKRRAVGQQALTSIESLAAITEGAALRLRPKTMMVAMILAGLLPALIGSGTGAES